MQPALPATPQRQFPKHSASAPARITQRDAFYKVQHLDTGLYIRVRANGALPRLTTSRLCTWFRSFKQAAECLSAFGPQPIEIERHDA